jgi:hypothetical protein
MANNKYSLTEPKIRKWIKEGRGDGRSRDYKPWLTVRDLPSQGRSHRVYGHKSQRTHHLFSDLELAVFLILEWQPEVVEVREQFPLQIELTLELAAGCGIRHPAVAGVEQYLSSDFLVDSRRKTLPKFALQAKRSEDLRKPRVMEKLELERRYWDHKDVPWFLITEKEIPAIVLQNIKWLYPAQRDEIAAEDLPQLVETYSYHFAANPNSTLTNIAKKIDVAYEQPPGESLREIRQLLAQRIFTFDIFKVCTKLTPADLVLTDSWGSEEDLHVQNK